jgi:hypothetical protein
VALAEPGDYVCPMTKTGLPVLGVLLAMLVGASPIDAATKTTSKPAAKPAPAAPATPSTDPGPAHPLGTVGAWTAYLAQNKTGKVCYLVGQPAKSESAGMKRKAPTAMVTHRTEDNVANVVSFAEGYALKEDTDVIVEVGSHKFELFPSDGSAWARTADLDKSIVETMARERQVVVRGTPQKGRATTDTYVLNGFAKALALIDKACDVKR